MMTVLLKQGHYQYETPMSINIQIVINKYHFLLNESFVETTETIIGSNPIVLWRRV